MVIYGDQEVPCLEVSGTLIPIRDSEELYEAVKESIVVDKGIPNKGTVKDYINLIYSTDRINFLERLQESRMINQDTLHILKHIEFDGDTLDKIESIVEENKKIEKQQYSYTVNKGEEFLSPREGRMIEIFDCLGSVQCVLLDPATKDLEIVDARSMEGYYIKVPDEQKGEHHYNRPLLERVVMMYEELKNEKEKEDFIKELYMESGINQVTLKELERRERSSSNVVGMAHFLNLFIWEKSTEEKDMFKPGDIIANIEDGPFKVKHHKSLVSYALESVKDKEDIKVLPKKYVEADFSRSKKGIESTLGNDLTEKEEKLTSPASK